MRTKRLFIVLYFLVLANLSSALPMEDAWTHIGSTHVATAPYAYLYYKVASIGTISDRYSVLFEVSVQGDVNYYNAQGTYTVRIEKYASSTRFDGIEVSCSSGNPVAAIFYVFNNELWIKSNHRWGNIYYRTVADFSNANPIPTSFVGVETPPTGFLASTADGAGLKCDFDNGKYYKSPYRSVTGQFISNGNILVGKSTQANPNYKVDVNGDIRANRMVVNTTGADFVFDSSYALMPLEDLKGYIDTHKHLPGIEPAVEMQKEGVDIGEIQNKLLQKIEELTLYIIYQNQVLQSQEQRLEEQSQKTKAIQERIADFSNSGYKSY